jgi:hypothetical protein
MVGGGTRRRRGGPSGSPDARVSSAIDPISRPRSDSPGHQAPARTTNKLKPLWFDAEVYCWSMIFSENRFPLFGIMLAQASKQLTFIIA